MCVKRLACELTMTKAPLPWRLLETLGMLEIPGQFVAARSHLACPPVESSWDVLCQCPFKYFLWSIHVNPNILVFLVVPPKQAQFWVVKTLVHPFPKNASDLALPHCIFVWSWHCIMCETANTRNKQTRVEISFTGDASGNPGEGGNIPSVVAAAFNWNQCILHKSFLIKKLVNWDGEIRLETSQLLKQHTSHYSTGFP